MHEIVIMFVYKFLYNFCVCLMFGNHLQIEFCIF